MSTRIEVCMDTYKNEYGRMFYIKGAKTPTWMSHNSSTRMHALGHTRIQKHYDNPTLISRPRQKEEVWNQ